MTISKITQSPQTGLTPTEIEYFDWFDDLCLRFEADTQGNYLDGTFSKEFVNKVNQRVKNVSRYLEKIS